MFLGKPNAQKSTILKHYLPPGGLLQSIFKRRYQEEGGELFSKGCIDLPLYERNGSYIICLLLGNFVVCYTLSCYLQITIFENDVPSPLFIFAYYSERAAYHNSEIMKDVHYKKRFTKLMPIE